MRFQKTMGKIDMEKAEKQIMDAFHGGVNYYDTAYVYPGSEAAIGEIFEKNGIRDQIYIATWNRLCDLSIKEWLADKKKSGAIRQIGFSYHGNSDMFCQLVDAYDWEFCQIQYNYMDEHTQAGRRGLHHAHEKGLPVVIMEPLRGGRLVNNLPEITCVLSGMNTEEMIADNIQTASTTTVGELGPEEEEMLQNVVKAINSRMKVGCTGCGYCMPCPKGVDIPGTFSAYNRRYYDSKHSGFF